MNSVRSQDTPLCPRCGSAFDCGRHAQPFECWCQAMPVLPSGKLDAARGCLCPECLVAEIAQAAQEAGRAGPA
ncbi:cysteine-rich CWC family protein [Paraburkholderia sp. BCC1886]|uniref:cysteine-rich CWC family protein n=1 Tax=Paraburkholderia sp. BCC1886 TaxID=2562670 RepID=UPI00118354F0|nr:cysteine-rich CWC family protein [Paraburkholderia sp. BCC1886]